MIWSLHLDFMCVTNSPLVYKKRSKAVLGIEEGNLKKYVKKLEVKEAEPCTRNQISGILLFHIIVIFIRVNLCYNKVL